MLSIFSRTCDFEKDPCNNNSKNYEEHRNTSNSSKLLHTHPEQVCYIVITQGERTIPEPQVSLNWESETLLGWPWPSYCPSLGLSTLIPEVRGRSTQWVFTSCTLHLNKGIVLYFKNNKKKKKEIHLTNEVKIFMNKKFFKF